MTECIQLLGDISIAVTRKDIKNIHLSVHPPDGRVTLSIPIQIRLEIARAYTITKLAWIKEQQKQLLSQNRETPRAFIESESHYLWGRRHLLTIIENDIKPFVKVDHRRIILSVRPGSKQAKRAAVIHEWHMSLLHEFIPAIINRWEIKLDVRVNVYFLRRMKTKWGSCNPKAGHIRFNTELVKNPRILSNM